MGGPEAKDRGGKPWIEELRTEAERFAPAGLVLDGLLGRGGMAEVYLAHRTGPRGFSRKVVVKRLLPSYRGDATMVERFVQEAGISAQFHHPHIVEIVELGVQDEAYYIVMEYLQGLHLGRILERLRMNDRRLPPEIAAYVGSCVASALDYAHKFVDEDGRRHEIIHRDVSVENIMVTETGQVKLLDFGVAKDMQGVSLTQGEQIIGKPLYLPPEAIAQQPATPARDVYSLGMTLWIALAAQAPYRASAGGSEGLVQLVMKITSEPLPWFADVGVDVPEELETIVRNALSKKPEDRDTASDLRKNLEAFLARRERVSADRLAHLMANLKNRDDDSMNLAAPDTAAVTGSEIIPVTPTPTTRGRMTMPQTEVAPTRTPRSLEGYPLRQPRARYALLAFLVAVPLMALALTMRRDDDSEGRTSVVTEIDPPGTTREAERAAPRPVPVEAYGTLQITCGAWGFIRVDQREVGICPNVTVSVPPGRHTVSLEVGGESQQTRLVSVPRRGRVVVDFTRRTTHPDIIVKPSAQ